MLVLRATIVGTLGDSTEKNLEMVNKGVVKAFEDYPPAKKLMRGSPTSVVRG
jgi:hypothetical protein